MQLDAFPRPPSDTRFGFCYFPDEEHYRPEDAERWVPQLRAMGASWLVLRGERIAPLPEAFVDAVLDASMEPVIHQYGEQIARIETSDLRRTAERYASWGVRYMCLYDQPNVRARWGADWGRPQLVERFVDLLLPGLQALQSAGLVPVLPPLEPGGHYWDLTFLASMLQSLKRRAPSALFDRLAVGMHNYADHRPIDWGAGGPQRWPGAQPYQTPGGSQDHMGFRLFEWYDSVVRAQLGRSLPLVSLGDGARFGAHAVPGAPMVTRAQHVAQHAAIVDAFASGQVPPYVLNSAFWLLAAARNDAAAAQAWFDESGQARTPAVKVLQERVQASRQPELEIRRHFSPTARGYTARSVPGPLPGTPALGAMPVARSAHPVPGSVAKAIHHYVLLPVFEWGPSDWHWQAAQRFVQALRASCGFSVDDARVAQRVTIVGNMQGIDAQVEEDLRAAGCEVVRVAGASGDETMRLLNELAEAGPHTAVPLHGGFDSNRELAAADSLGRRTR